MKLFNSLTLCYQSVGVKLSQEIQFMSSSYFYDVLDNLIRCG